MRSTGPTKLPPDPRTPPSRNPAKEREIVEPQTNAMQANLPKKCDVTAEKQVFMKFCNSFAESDHCTAGVCGLFQFALWPVIARTILEPAVLRTKIRQRQPFRLLWRVIRRI